MGTVVLVRHGETAWNDEHRVQGWAPVGLNDRGREQGTTLGRHLAAEYDIDRLIASDLRRTVETLREIRRAVDTDDVTTDRAWRERDFGVLQGLGYAELFQGYPEFSVLESGYEGASATPESGESWLDFDGRVRDAWGELRKSVGDETIVVVTHGGPIHVILGKIHGLDIVETIRDIDVGNCAVTEIEVDGDEVTLGRECDIGFVED
ncbi:histidine phosphatase family protein [Natranaeroarchaeum sulfidigenes]|uniref:Broad specificity phosphatase PhoE or related phosphatase n=1 Tax=Natranaeroarchaeum sulfidigenes TaxID=2784880 RepID=A0A897MQ39_9EURY|nr:histidine phosphatase family protein [Natranaeroarchaeum sulfidigenes]QSG04270.1 Broad specificity phosphatase PhoE or related phosphatase [Natranaeroarchaeum sulfidigenes]